LHRPSGRWLTVFATLTVPRSTTVTGTGTIAKAQLNNSVGDAATNLLAGVTSGTQDCVVDVAVVTAGNTINFADMRFYAKPTLSTVAISTTLRTRILEYLLKKNTVVFSGTGTIKVYTGSAPASADTAATGTELVSFATSTTSWNAASSSSSALASTLSASASNSGTAGYARFSWTDGSNTYVIQGSIGTAATDFIINTVTIVATTSYNLTAATMGY
jgi:hypothetical protein